MPTYKLMYFNVTGRAESIRYMFHYAGIKFEDVRVTYEDWLKVKADMPMEKLPVLEIDGIKYHQSKAIGRYVAKQCNLYSSDEAEALEIDATIESLDDMKEFTHVYHGGRDPVLKEKYKEITYEKLPYYLDKFEEQVKKNGGHFIRGKLTWADIMYTAYIGVVCETVAKEMNLDNHPELKKLMNKVNAIPSIKAYLDKRPKTMF